jgi:hypothetical protein
MAERKKAKKKKAKRERKERRFLPEQTQSSKYAAIGGMVGAAVLGAGVYGQWIRAWATEGATEISYARFLVAGGAIGLGLALWFSDAGGSTIRVGAAGVGVEKGSELTRIAWCDLSRVYVEAGKLVLEGEETTLSITIAPNRTAVAWILKEGTLRVPDAMDVKPRDSDGLPTPKDDDGEQVEMLQVQVSGRHCKNSGKVISFEKDARLCPNCAEVYHHAHVPKKCATCGEQIGERAYAI